MNGIKSITSKLLVFSNAHLSRFLLRVGVSLAVQNGSVLIGSGITIGSYSSGALSWLWIGIGLVLLVIGWLWWLSQTISPKPTKLEWCYRIGLLGWGVLGYVFGVARGLAWATLIG